MQTLTRNIPRDGRLLLIACSSAKRRRSGLLPAKFLYTGGLLKLSLRLARVYGLHPLILSAKHGLVEINRPLAYYDQKLEEPYTGPWPVGDGFYVGSPLYFGKAPSRYRRLLPEGLPIGKQLAYLKRLLAKGLPE